MLECSGAASAVNADVMYCKDGMIRGFLIFLFFFLTVVCGSSYLTLSRTEHALIHVHE